MERHSVVESEYQAIRARYSLTDAELEIENSSETESTPIHSAHRRLCDALEADIKAKGLSPLDDIYIDFDFFRNRVIILNIDEGRDDLQLRAEEIAAEQIGKISPDFAVMLIAGGSSGLPLGGERELITSRGIYVHSAKP